MSESDSKTFPKVPTKHLLTKKTVYTKHLQIRQNTEKQHV